MRITCERSYLAMALGVAGRAVSNRNTLPILSNVLLETEDDRLKLTATDLDTAIRCVIPAAVAENGAVAVPAGILNDVVSKLPDAPVTLEMQDGKVTVRCGKSDYMILSLPAEDFPVVPEVTEGTDITLPQATLKGMLRMTTFAASKEETRSLLMGVLFEARNNALTLVATDTHRLAWKRTQLGEEVGQPVTAIVPAKPLAELERVLKDTVDDTVHVRFGASQVQFETSDVTLVSRVLDGQFPNYEKVIPKGAERKITFERGDFLDAVRRVYIVARQNSEKAIVKTKGDLMEMTAESQEIGRAYEEVPIALDGGDITIAFNARYLMEVLNMLDTEQVSLELTGALNPGILKSQDADFLYVVMPMQV
ncbi:MAG: DNA polymerase III subunit beta [Abitibacteriaceae bacterium]|nr:DNA polymerase III subunit beta [Abditibacteriaceae bacterium]